MRNVSNQYIETMAHRRDFYAEAEITFADGETKTVNKKDFWISGNSFTHSAGGSSFPIGMLIAKRITFSLNNEDDQWSEYDFFGAKIQLFTRFLLDDGKIESLNMGEFTVITPETYGTTVEVTAMDESYKTDIEYSTGLAAPVSVGLALRDSCANCGITLLTTTFKNDDFIIHTIPEKITHRQFIGMCAMLAGGNAVLDEYNRLKIITYDLSALGNSGLDGGKFDQLGLSEYVTGDIADGGNFAPWDVGYIADGGSFGDRKNIHVLYEVKSGMTVGVDDVVITGVQMQDEEGEVHLYGKEGYVISTENQLAIGKEDEAVQRIGDILVGLRFRPFTAEHIAYPLAEFMDPAFIIDRKQNVYQTVLTDIEFKYFGFTTLKCTADSPLRNSSKYNNAAAKAVIESRKIVNEKISQYDRTMQTLTNLMTQSFGVFKTEEVLEDGSTVFYMHNKPTLEESQTIWKMTADVFAVSTDGGETWNAGLDSEGNAVVNVLSAIGIQFEWARGGVLSLGGDNNINGQINIFDKNNVLCGRIDNDGIYIFSPGTSRYVIISPTTGFRYHTTGGTYIGAFFSKTVQLAPEDVEKTRNPYVYGTLKDGSGYPSQIGPIKTYQIGYFQDNDTASRTEKEHTTTIGDLTIPIGYTYTYAASHSNVVFPCSSYVFDADGTYQYSYQISHLNVYNNAISTPYHISIELPEEFKYATDIDVQIDFKWNNPYLDEKYADKIFGLKFTANNDAYLPSCANGVEYSVYYEIGTTYLAPTPSNWLKNGPRAYIPAYITTGSVQKPSSYAKSEAAKQDDNVRFQIIKASEVNLPAVLPETYQVYPNYSYNFSTDNATLELDIGVAVNIHSSILGDGAIDLTECFQIYVGLSA